MENDSNGNTGNTGNTGGEGPKGIQDLRDPQRINRIYGETGMQGPAPSQTSATGNEVDNSVHLATTSASEESPSPEAQRQGIEKTENEIKKIFPDIPDGKEDKTGFHYISESILDLINNTNLKPPFNIGLLGSYGSGKTKILNQIIEKNSKKPNRRNSIITFDAGRFHDSKFIWIALIMSFFNSFKNEYGWKSSIKFFFSCTFWEWFWKCLVILSFLALSIVLIWFSFQTIGAKLRIIYGISFLLPSILLFLRLKRLWSNPLIKTILSELFSIQTKILENEYRSRLELEAALKRLFEVWVDDTRRVVLIIDNLDRCNNENVIGIIDEIFSLMNTPIICSKLVAILAVDEQLLIDTYKKRTGGDENKAKEYFEKMFSLKVYMPKFDPEMLELFLYEKLELKPMQYSTPGNDFHKEISDYDLAESEKESIRTCLINITETEESLHPRKIMRIVFSYQFLKYLWARWDNDKNEFDEEKIINYLVNKSYNQSPPHMSKEEIKYLNIVEN